MEITIAELVANPQLLETAMENNKNWFVVNRYLTITVFDCSSNDMSQSTSIPTNTMHGEQTK